MDNNMFKKIYIEISNVCNLNCPFCSKTKREKRFLSIEEFKIILGKIKGYTNYLYFHVLGEPLLHPNINEFIDEASKQGFFINLTTNGYLINNLKNKNIRQINISLHSYNIKYGKKLDDYMGDLYKFADKNKNIFINYRLWTNSNYKDEIIKSLSKKYQKEINEIKNNITLNNNVFLNFDNEFIWPDNNDNKKEYEGTCHALKDHIAILSNGTITACCLDASGKINLGNIFDDDVDSVLNSSLFSEMKNGFKNGKRIHPLCKKCNFLSIKKYQ